MQTQEQADNLQMTQLEIQNVELDSPITMGDTVISTLEIRNPNNQALQGMKIADLLQGDVTSICTLLPRICTPTLTKTQINQLTPSDMAQIAGIIMVFLQPKSVRVQLLQQR
ncbi:phage tail assembly protein [Acinetobacter seifertii]|uniref:phage tail assembly protein n=1 Tax=Acinetobacter seifertii TaxID=1530123 RepID=UPI00124F0BC5|nr:phage tail assembly protein [Acinetobacter seifertii]